MERFSNVTSVKIVYLFFTDGKVTPTGVTGRPRPSEEVSECFFNGRLQDLQIVRRATQGGKSELFVLTVRGYKDRYDRQHSLNKYRLMHKIYS